MSKNSSDQETVKRSSIDRPRRKPQKKFKIEEEVSLISEEEEYHLKEYDAIRSEYNEFSISNTIVNILNKVVQMSSNPNATFQKATMQLLLSASKDLALNEMEASLLTIILERIDWINLSNSCYLDLLFAAYASKSYLNENLKPFNVHLEKMNANFLINYESWYSSHKHLLKTDSKEINSRFKEYSKPYLGLGEVQIIDYNHCVDDILRNANDSSVKEEKEEEKLEDIDKEEDEESETNENSPGKNSKETIVSEEAPANPIFALDTLSPLLQSEEMNRDKSPQSFDDFLKTMKKLELDPSAQVFEGNGTPGYGLTPLQSQSSTFSSFQSPGFQNQNSTFSSFQSPGFQSPGFQNQNSTFSSFQSPGFQSQNSTLSSFQSPGLQNQNSTFSSIVSSELSPFYGSSAFNGFPSYNE